MTIKVIKCTNHTGWYKNRIGETFTVIKESLTFEGKPMYVTHIEKDGNCTITDYVLADDCVITD